MIPRRVAVIPKPQRGEGSRAQYFAVAVRRSESGISVYINLASMYIICYLSKHGNKSMRPASNRSHKHFQLDVVKIKRAQKALRAKTETETIERALDLAIAEERRNRLVLEATERFLKSGIEIQDVYGTLGR